MSAKHRINQNSFLALGYSLLFSVMCTTTFAQNSVDENVILSNLRIIVGDGSVLQNTSILLRGDTIAALGNSDAITLPPNTRQIDMTGKTLLPALIDAHAHLGYEGFSSWGAENYTLDNLIEHLNRYAYYGFGSVFSAGSDPDVLALELQSLQARGEASGARFLFAAGMAPPGQGPNNQFLVEALVVEQRTGNTILRGLANTEQAREAVQAVAALQIPFIKIWVDDRGGSQTKLQPAIYRAVIAEAQRQGIAVLVHQQAAQDMPDLITAGAYGFLHGRLEHEFTAAIATAARENNVFIVPNLGLAELRREAIGDDLFLAQTIPSDVAARLSNSAQRQSVPAPNAELEAAVRNSFTYMLEAGVDIVLGTDAGAVPDHPFGYTGHRELEIFVRHGMSPMQALIAATSVPARILGLEKVGQVKVGFLADLLILNDNPLEDIRHTRSIHQVYLRGKQVDRAALATSFTIGSSGN